MSDDKETDVWTNLDFSNAFDQGWVLSSLFGIRRTIHNLRFRSNKDALTFVTAKARKGDALAQKAICLAMRKKLNAL